MTMIISVSSCLRRGDSLSGAKANHSKLLNSKERPMTITKQVKMLVRDDYVNSRTIIKIWKKYSQ